MQKIIVTIDLPRQNKNQMLHKAHINLTGSIGEIAQQLLDIQAQYPDVQINTGVPQVFS